MVSDWFNAGIGILTVGMMLWSLARSLSFYFQAGRSVDKELFRVHVVALGVVLAVGGVILICLLTDVLTDSGLAFGFLGLMLASELSLFTYVMNGLLETKERHFEAERTSSEEKVREERDKLQIVIDALPGMVSWISFDMKYLGANRFLLNLLNLSVEELKGRDVGFSGENTNFVEFVRRVIQSSEKQVVEELTMKVGTESVRLSLIGQHYSDTEVVILGFELSQRAKSAA